MHDFQLTIIAGRLVYDPRLVEVAPGATAAQTRIVAQTFTVRHGIPQRQTIGIDLYVMGGARAHDILRRWRKGTGVMVIGRLMVTEERRIALEADHIIEAPLAPHAAAADGGGGMPRTPDGGFDWGALVPAAAADGGRR